MLFSFSNSLLKPVETSFIKDEANFFNKYHLNFKKL